MASAQACDVVSLRHTPRPGPAVTAVAIGAALLLPGVAFGQAPPPAQNPVTTMSPAAKLPVSPGMKLPGEAEGYPNTAPATPVHVAHISIEGSTVYSKAELAAMTKGLIGPATPASSIEAARLAILRRYREAGYPLVTVSAALDRAGNLRFVVVEGRISDVKLEGDIGPAGTKVLDFLGNLVKPGPSRTDDIERWLLLAQDVPGVSLQTVLRPSEAEPGSLVLVARVSRTAVSGFVMADNRAYKYTGPVEGLAVVGLNSLTSWGERTEVSLYRSLLNPEQIFGQADVETFIGSSGLKLRLYGGAGSTRPGGTLSSANYSGTTQVAGLRLSYPLIYTRRQKLEMIGNFDLFDSQTNGAGIATADSLRILRFGFDYARLDLLAGAQRPAENRVSIRINQGLQFLGASHNGQLTLSRLGEDITFFSVTGSLSRNQVLFSPWRDSTVALQMQVSGQKSGNILPTEEQYHLGGLLPVRGYYSGEVAGDSAISTSLELQLNTSVPFTVFGKPRDVAMQFYSFYDWGEGWNNTPQVYATHVSSVGIGMRSALTRSLEFDMEGVTRLNRQPASSNALVAPLPAQAVYWRVLYRF